MYVKSLANDLIDTMVAHRAAGLSAIQIGISLRIAAIHAKVIEGTDGLTHLCHYYPLSEATPMIIIDPKNVEIDGAYNNEEEGCLSFPNINIQVSRPSSLHFEATTLSGEVKKYFATGIVAQCVLHEIEHMDGKLLVDNASVIQQVKIKNKMKMRKVK
jgi:peptide deformylase